MRQSRKLALPQKCRGGTFSTLASVGRSSWLPGMHMTGTPRSFIIERKRS